MRTSIRRRAVAAGMAAIAAPLLIMSAASQASAAPSGPSAREPEVCAGSTCNGLVAANTACVNTARVVSSAQIPGPTSDLGYVQLWYSSGCRATWGRVIRYDVPGLVGEKAWVRNSNGTIYECEAPVSIAGCNTLMVDDENLLSYATGGITIDDGVLGGNQLTKTVTQDTGKY